MATFLSFTGKRRRKGKKKKKKEENWKKKKEERKRKRGKNRRKQSKHCDSKLSQNCYLITVSVQASPFQISNVNYKSKFYFNIR